MGVSSITALAFIIRLHKICHFWSHEQNRVASNSELRRWLDNGSIHFNREATKANELIDFEVFSLIFFPKSNKNRITLV